MDTQRPETEEGLEEQLARDQKPDETPTETLRADLEDEFEEPAEKTEDDERVEAEMKLTGEEEKWKQDMHLRIKEWKRETSAYPPEIHSAIGKIREEKTDQEDIVLFHAFRQLQKSPSPYFRQKFGRALRKRERETRSDIDSTAFQLTKVLRALSEVEQ